MEYGIGLGLWYIFLALVNVAGVLFGVLVGRTNAKEAVDRLSEIKEQLRSTKFALVWWIALGVSLGIYLWMFGLKVWLVVLGVAGWVISTIILIVHLGWLRKQKKQMDEVRDPINLKG